MGHGADVLPERGTQRSVALSPNVPELFMPNGGKADISYSKGHMMNKMLFFWNSNKRAFH